MKTLVIAVTVALASMFAAVQAQNINESEAQKVAVPFDTCKPEVGVEFNGNQGLRLKTKEIEELLAGNTLLSVDRYGTFAIYYPSDKETIGWVPKEKRTNYDWSRGTVTFENDKYCRKWKDLESGKHVNCWLVHPGPMRVDMPSLCFACENGVPDGDQHVVFNGNILEVKERSNGLSGQNDEIAEELWTKYLSAYVNK